ncbi:MAG: amidohydrolase family protein [Bacteroidota bacterium]|nr:amidohydrolase family protein [Bacteroidota bacterium]
MIQQFIKRLIFYTLLCFLSYTCLAQTTFPVNGPHDVRQTCFAFINANIQVDAQTLITNCILIIKDGKIVNVGTGIAIPGEAKVKDLKGRFIYPGFIDLYSNYGIQWNSNNKGKNEQYTNNKPGAYAWNDAIRADVNASNFFQYDEKRSNFYLESGFGSTLSGIQDGICRGTSVLVCTGKAHEQKLILNRNAAAGFSLNKGSSIQEYPGSAMGSIALLRQTYYDADWYSKQNREQNISLEAFNKLKVLPAVFEVTNKLSVLRAAKIGMEFNTTYIIKSAGDEYQRLDEIKTTNSPVIIPLNFPKPFEVEDPFEAQFVSLSDLKHWELAPANPYLLAKAGISFAFTASGCSDAAEFLKNLRTSIKYGLTETQALQALTTIPAQLIHAEKQIGALRAGMMANFFISNKNIFEKEAIIQEHWTLGIQQFVKSDDDKLLSGKYKLTLKGYEDAMLSISGTAPKFEAILFTRDTVKVSIQENLGLITLAFKVNKKAEEMIRIDAWVFEKNPNSLQVQSLMGKAQMEDGSYQSFLASYVEAVPPKNKKDTITKVSYGAVIYPFTDYGNKVLPKQETYLFKNATVWTNETPAVLTQTDVVVSKGKIINIGTGLSIKDAIIIDASGKYITSGIIDEHSHIGIYRGVNECSQAVTAEVNIGDVINSDDINIYRQLSGGVTGCQQLHGSCNPVGGQSSIIKLRWGLPPEAMKIAGADGFIKFALGENVKQSNWGIETSRYPQSRMGVEQVYYDAFIRAREYEQKMKANPKLTRKDLELETLLEILKGKRFITCHSYVQSEINMLMHVADSLGFKVNTFTHILEGYKVADKMKAHKVNASSFADWWAYKYEVVDAIPYNAAILNKMGITTAINSDDAEMGRRLNQEAAKIIKYGNISEEEAWKMVTLNPAKMLHLDAQTGSIKIGKDADLVMWSANPLSIYAKAEMTLVDGICYYSIALDAELRKYIQSERQRIITKMIQAKQNGEKAERKVSSVDENYHCND